MKLYQSQVLRAENLQDLSHHTVWWVLSLRRVFFLCRVIFFPLFFCFSLSKKKATIVSSFGMLAGVWVRLYGEFYMHCVFMYVCMWKLYMLASKKVIGNACFFACVFFCFKSVKNLSLINLVNNMHCNDIEK